MLGSHRQEPWQCAEVTRSVINICWRTNHCCNAVAAALAESDEEPELPSGSSSDDMDPVTRLYNERMRHQPVFPIQKLLQRVRALTHPLIAHNIAAQELDCECFLLSDLHTQF